MGLIAVLVSVTGGEGTEGRGSQNNRVVLYLTVSPGNTLTPPLLLALFRDHINRVSIYTPWTVWLHFIFALFAFSSTFNIEQEVNLNCFTSESPQRGPGGDTRVHARRKWGTHVYPLFPATVRRAKKTNLKTILVAYSSNRLFV